MSLLPPLVQFVEMGQQTAEAAQALATSVLEKCGVPVEASAGIASATYTTPLVTVLAAQLLFQHRQKYDRQAADSRI